MNIYIVHIVSESSFNNLPPTPNRELMTLMPIPIVGAGDFFEFAEKYESRTGNGDFIKELFNNRSIINAAGHQIRPQNEIDLVNFNAAIRYESESVFTHTESYIFLPSNYNAFSRLHNGLALATQFPCTALITYKNSAGVYEQQRLPVHYIDDLDQVSIGVPESVGNVTDLYFSSIELIVTEDQVLDIIDKNGQPPSLKILSLADLITIGYIYRDRFANTTGEMLSNGIPIDTIRNNIDQYRFKITEDDLRIENASKPLLIIPAHVRMGITAINNVRDIPFYTTTFNEQYVGPHIALVEFENESGITLGISVPIVTIQGYNGSKIIATQALVELTGKNFSMKLDTRPFNES